MNERDFVNAIRQEYSGLRDLPRDSLASSVKTLADDLYAKDTHFIFELIQNAEDNDYGPATLPRLAFEISSQEIEGKSGPVLIVRNNETGFQEDHVKALCQVGKSTKKKAQGYIGEKGIGFKSVFRVTRCPYIFSNGFQFCLPDHDEETGLGYIVPRWVPHLPKNTRGTETTIVLPLDREDSNAKMIAEALHDFAPETILFLQKLNSIQVSVHLPDIEYEVEVEKHVLADIGGSKLVELTYLRRIGDEEILRSSRYWLTESEYPKPIDVHHEKRNGIESRRVSVAIPLDWEQPGGPKGKLFAYLPVWEETGLPFVINADFVLVSSREGIREDEPWNKWLRDCAEETLCTSFFTLLNCNDVDLEKRVIAYGSIPLVSHRPFLSPLIRNIQGRLAGRKCVMALPDNMLAAPSSARLSNQSLRKILGPADHFPRFLHGEVRLVHPELERSFVEQLSAIGVSQITSHEVVRALQDRDWVQGHDRTWYLALYDYLRSHKIDPATLRNLAIVPIAQDWRIVPLLSCDQEQHIYFFCSGADQIALASAPHWLSELVSIAFLDADFLSALDNHEDKEDLRKWMTESLNVCEFSIEKYCVDILSRITREYQALTAEQLVEATAFLSQYAGKDLNWKALPVVLSDDRRMLLGDTHQQQDGTSSVLTLQGVVVPDNYDLERGWQHIWNNESGRHHFVALSRAYPTDLVKALTITGCILEYPPAPKICIKRSWDGNEYERSCLRRIDYTHFHKITNWRPPSCLLPNYRVDAHTSNAIASWLKSYSLVGSARATAEFFYYKDRSESFTSELLDRLKAVAWLTSTKGLVRPTDAFVPKQEIQEVFGDTVPYFEGDLAEDTLRLLGVRSTITVADLTALLQEHSTRGEINLDMVERVYAQLAARHRSLLQGIGDQFSKSALILAKDSRGTMHWNRSSDCVWEDASRVFGDAFVYLEGQYPKLQDFFVERLGVKRRVDPESFAQRWLKLQENPVADTGQQRVIVAQLYREIRTISQMADESRPPWWREFSVSAKVYTQSDKFERPTKTVLPDDGELRDIFKGNRVEFAWRPEKDAFSEWASLYTALGTPLLSESVIERLVEEPDFAILPCRRFVSEASIKMIAAWLREKRRSDYDRLFKDEVFARLAAMREAQTSSTIKVQFRLRVHAIDETKTVIYPVFWKREDNILIYGAEPRKDQIARTIAKGLVPGQAYKDLAHWIELVLEATDTTRLKHEGWSVPEEISTLLTPRLPGSPTAQSPGDLEDHTDPTDSGNPILGPDQPLSTDFPEPGGPSSYSPKPRNKPGSGHEPQSDNGAKGGTDETPKVNIKELLEETFNRPDRASIQDEEEFDYDDDGGHVVKNPGRRKDKLVDGYIEGIIDEPSPEDRRRLTERTLLEGPNEQVRVSLYEWYRGKCQICGETWPKLDGEPYFTAAYLVERKHARWLDEPGNAICLCAKHFAQWRHAAKENPLGIFDQIKSLRLRNEGGNGDLSIDFVLLGADVSITYDERHFLALRTLLEVTTEQGENRSSE